MIERDTQRNFVKPARDIFPGSVIELERCYIYPRYDNNRGVSGYSEWIQNSKVLVISALPTLSKGVIIYLYAYSLQTFGWTWIEDEI